MFNQIIVVEGRHDEARIKEAFADCQCIITNGSEISRETLNIIKQLSLTHQIVIFTDPDYPGERIRSKVLEIIPNALHAFIPKNKCISSNKKKVGVEHASIEDIKYALGNLLTPSALKSNLSSNDLIELGLAGSIESKKKREVLCNYLNIGNPNAKTLLKRLHMLGYNKENLVKLVGDIYEKNRNS